MKKFCFTLLLLAFSQAQANTKNIFFTCGLTEGETCIDKQEIYTQAQIMCDSFLFTKESVIEDITDENIKRHFSYAYDFFRSPKGSKHILARTLYENTKDREKHIIESDINVPMNTQGEIIGKVSNHLLKEFEENKLAIPSLLLGLYLKKAEIPLKMAGSRYLDPQYINNCVYNYAQVCMKLYPSNIPICED